MQEKLEPEQQLQQRQQPQFQQQMQRSAAATPPKPIPSSALQEAPWNQPRSKQDEARQAWDDFCDELGAGRGGPAHFRGEVLSEFIGRYYN